jgi:hypothetical protein
VAGLACGGDPEPPLRNDRGTDGRGRLLPQAPKPRAITQPRPRCRVIVNKDLATIKNQ